uniref:Nematode cuticle collagen N-terminal domain-containing protein n=1 Tax=Ditylenchus dipsaci TaxID=166011 RepID=A0A915EPE2_9BILA
MGLTSHSVAVFGIFVSSVTLFSILFLVPIIVLKANQLRVEVEERSIEFKERSDKIWNQIQVLNSAISGRVQASNEPPIIMFSRVKKSAWNKHICQAVTLSLAQWTIWSWRPPGTDGTPGESGKQGPPGEDGFDVQLESEHDLPCVICPSGPPGQRGSQGERGLSGGPGGPGVMGPSGRQGTSGQIGNPGPSGNRGTKGELGHVGPPGDTTVAGVGIKGPQGPPGSAGPKGPPGVPGKTSKDMGVPGKPGIIGLAGLTGIIGEPGSEGPWGHPENLGNQPLIVPRTVECLKYLLLVILWLERTEEMIKWNSKVQLRTLTTQNNSHMNQWWSLQCWLIQPTSW